MSHFTVLVIGDDVESLLAPYHEYECTGRMDEFVVFVDHTDEVKKEWEEGTTTMMRNIETGELFTRHHDSFYREPTAEEIEKIGIMAGTGWGNGIHWESKDWNDGKGYRTKIYNDNPEGFEKVNLGLDNEYTSIADYAKRYHGHVIVDDKIGRYTNPNSKWDWWVVGGRWNNMLALKKMELLPDPNVIQQFGFSAAEFSMLAKLQLSDNAKFENLISKYNGKTNDIREYITTYNTPVYAPGFSGEDGLMGSCHTKEKGWASQALKKHVDFELMRQRDIDRHTEDWKAAYAVVKDLPKPRTFKDIREDCEKYGKDIDEARTIFWSQPALEAKKDIPVENQYIDIADSFLWDENGLEKYIESKDCGAITFAVCTKDGWFERGEMGWWGCVSNEKLPYDWAGKFTELIEATDDDTLISVVDCHI